jgi:hypothetical protein
MKDGRNDSISDVSTDVVIYILSFDQYVKRKEQFEAYLPWEL